MSYVQEQVYFETYKAALSSLLVRAQFMADAVNEASALAAQAMRLTPTDFTSDHVIRDNLPHPEKRGPGRPRKESSTNE